MKRGVVAGRRHGLDQLALGRADVGDDRGVAARGERLRDQLGQRPDRRRAEHHLGVLRRPPRRSPRRGRAHPARAPGRGSVGAGVEPDHLGLRAAASRRARSSHRSGRRRGRRPSTSAHAVTSLPATSATRRSCSAYSPKSAVGSACGPSQIACSGSLWTSTMIAVGARRRGGHRHRRDPVAPPRSVARVDDDRQVRQLAQRRDRQQVEGEPVGGLERADAALAEDHVRDSPP